MKRFSCLVRWRGAAAFVRQLIRVDECVAHGFELIWLNATQLLGALQPRRDIWKDK